MWSPEEIQAAVEKLVRSSIRRPVDALGARRTDVSFGDIQEAAAGVFLLYPNAPYGVVFLGAQRLRDALSAEVSVVQRVLDAIDAAGRRAMPITDTSALSNATAALGELESASTARAGGFKDVTRAPAYQRFDANVAAFLSGPASNIRANGTVVQTPEQARRALPGLITELREQHAALIRGVTYLAKAMEDYGRVNLPSLVAQGVLGRSRAVLAEHARTMAHLSSEARLEKVRDVTLDVLAARAVVRSLGSFSGPTEFLALRGTGRPYSDATHAATPAAIAADKLNAYAIVAGENELVITADPSGAPTSIFLTPSALASLEGGIGESEGTPGGFRIGDGTRPAPPAGGVAPNNNKFALEVRSYNVATRYTATLTVSPSFTSLTSAEQIAQDLNAALPPGVHARPVFFPQRYAGALDVAASSGPQTTASAPAGASTDFQALGVVPGDLVSVTSGLNLGLFTVEALPAPTQLRITRSSGVFAAQVRAPCEIGPRGRRLRIACVEPKGQLADATSIRVLAPDAVAEAGEATLGFAVGLSSQCVRSTCQDVADGIQAQGSGVAASVRYIARVAGVTGRLSATNPFQISLFTFTGAADARFDGAVLTLSGLLNGAGADAVGQRLVLRTGPNPGLWGTVISVLEDSITATMNAPGVNASRVLFDIGPSFAPLEFQTLRIATGPNQGDHLVHGAGDTPLDVALTRALVASGRGATPDTFSASLGDTAVVVASTTRTTTSSIEVRGSAAPLLFSSTPASAYGTSPYVRLPQAPRGVSAGDRLEVHAADYQTPSQTFRIEDVETTSPIVRIAPEIASNASLTFGEQPPPFARIRFARSADFATLEGRLSAWLARPSAKASFFVDLNRFINPLVASANPTAVQVGAARDRVASLLSELSVAGASARAADSTLCLEFALSNYDVQPVPALNTLLRSYKEKGADRAIDILTQGQFSVFFSLAHDDASYAGAMQARMREVARQDLPIQKAGRADALQGRTIAAATSPDYEDDVSDAVSTSRQRIPE